MENFTPITALLGGALIGFATAILLLLNGRIAGISGILSGIWTGPNGDKMWRVVFIIGLILGSYLTLLTGADAPSSPASSYPLLIAGGLLVGAGTKIGSGCTSGHGVCGIGRLSKRSIAATSIFMATAIFTVWIMRQVL